MSIESISADLSAALMRLDRAFEEHNSNAYRKAAVLADELRADLAAEPAVDQRGLSLKLRSLGAVPTSALASLSHGEALLLSSCVADARRLLIPREHRVWPLVRPSPPESSSHPPVTNARLNTGRFRFRGSLTAGDSHNTA